MYSVGLLNLFLPWWIFTSLSQIYSRHFSKVFFHSFISTVQSGPCPFLLFLFWNISRIAHSPPGKMSIKADQEDISGQERSKREQPLRYLPPALLTESLPLWGWGGGWVSRFWENVWWPLPLLILQEDQLDGTELLRFSGPSALGPKFQSLQTKRKKESTQQHKSAIW